MEKGQDFKIEKKSEPKPGEVKVFSDGKKYRWEPSGYTVRQWFSHESEKGPGPGWDSFLSRAEELVKKYGIKKKPFLLKPNDLPDEPYYQWKPMFDED